jgi:ribosomal-protein-alanine N-acetyltransferase
MVAIPTVETSRLKLRPFTEQDEESLYQILRGDDVLRYFPNPIPPDREKVAKLIAAQLKHWGDHGFGWWAVESLEEGELMGWNGLQFLPDTEEIEVGYLLGRPFWDKGFATEGAKAGLEFGFDGLGLETIIGLVHPENEGSKRVLEKLGMSFVEQAEYFGITVLRYVLPRESFHGQR